jgi:thiol-disulfide isomerase/thioredoxin
MDRRSFLESMAMTFAAARFGTLNTADPLGRATQWLNSPPLTLASLRGKVVLVDFCTYTCINWLRTLPYLRAWSEKYRQGLVVVGVHTPEFAFEKNVDNVRRALQQMKIEYPVAIDNDYAVWRAFSNNYWPALYFIDARGRTRQHHFGEGEYEQSEKSIQRLLTEAGIAGIGDDLVSVEGRGIEAAPDWQNVKSSENYLGSARTENFVSGGKLTLNQWSVNGDWTRGPLAIALNKANGRITYRFHARDLHLVMGPSAGSASVRFRVSIDGQPPGMAHGGDVDESGNGVVAEQRLYQLIRQPKPIVDRQFEIQFLEPGVEAFSFTFG